MNIEIVFTDGNIVKFLTEIETGQVDATISSIIITPLTADSLGYKIDSFPITDPEWLSISVNSIHLLFQKMKKPSVISSTLPSGSLTATVNCRERLPRGGCGAA